MIARFLLLLVFIGQVQNWTTPFFYERPIPLTFVRTSIEQSDDSPVSTFNEIQQIMNRMYDRFDRMFAWPSWFHHPHFYDHNEDENEQMMSDETEENLDTWIEKEKPLNDLKHQLDAVEPVCTTVVNTPPTISPRKSRRKKQRTTQTKTCVKELIVNGEKFILQEETTTDDQGVLIKQSKNYSQISMLIQNNATTTPVPDY